MQEHQYCNLGNNNIITLDRQVTSNRPCGGERRRRETHTVYCWSLAYPVLLLCATWKVIITTFEFTNTSLWIIHVQSRSAYFLSRWKVNDMKVKPIGGSRGTRCLWDAGSKSAIEQAEMFTGRFKKFKWKPGWNKKLENCYRKLCVRYCDSFTAYHGGWIDIIVISVFR